MEYYLSVDASRTRTSRLSAAIDDAMILYVSIGMAEILQDSARRVAEKAQEKGGDVADVNSEQMIPDESRLFPTSCS